MARLGKYAIASVLSAAFLAAGLSSSSAQDAYPSREIRVICAFPAGSGADVFARFFAEGMKPAFDKNIIVENRVGASGNLATNFVARAKPDGYTLYIHAPSALAANMHLFKDRALMPARVSTFWGPWRCFRLLSPWQPTSRGKICASSSRM